MIKRGISPEVVRHQMRNKKIETTMKVYVQVNSKDLEESILIRFVPDANFEKNYSGNLIKFPTQKINL